MPELNPAGWLQNSGATNSAQLTRLHVGSLSAGFTSNLSGRGGVNPTYGGALVVTAGAGLSVNVASGVAHVPGTDDASQGAYVCVNTSTVNKTLTAADGSNPRIDLIVARVHDSFYDLGPDDEWELDVVTGTPAGSPVVPTPGFDNYLALASVSVPASATSPGTITDLRVFLTAMGGIVPSIGSTDPSAGRYDGLYRDLAGVLQRWSSGGSAWEDVASADAFANIALGAQRIATIDTGSGTNTTEFASIPQTFRDLIVSWKGRSDGTGEIDSLNVRFNGDAGTNYISLFTGNTAANAFECDTSSTSFTVIRAGKVGTASQGRSAGFFWVPGYRDGYRKHAVGISFARGTSGGTNLFLHQGGGFWDSTAAITTIRLWPSGQLWADNPVITLIGIP